MDADWAALNAAQQAAFVLSLLVGLFIMNKLINRGLAQRWPWGMLIVLILLVTGVAAAVMSFIVLGVDEPK